MVIYIKANKITDWKTYNTFDKTGYGFVYRYPIISPINKCGWIVIEKID
jgi:hypothetical protein